MKTPLGIAIGADPEFEFHDSLGNLGRAYQVLGQGGRNLGGALGTDGAASTAELRLTPPGSYYRLMPVLSRLIGEASQAAMGYTAYAGSGRLVSCGGHIHFSGLPLEIPRGATVHLTEHPFISRLDKFITRPLNSVSNTRIRRPHYGRLGETRWQAWGFEYRAPLSWICHPVIAEGTLAIAWTLARAFKFGDIESIGDWDDILEYAYKRERIAIKAFIAAIKQYKRDGTKLETIEMFAAWKKTQKPKPQHLFTINDRDFGLWNLLGFVNSHQEHRRTASRYNPFMCYVPVSVFGIRQSRDEGQAVYLTPNMTRYLDGRLQHLGVELKTLPADIRQNDRGIGLTHQLRENTKKSAWVVKRIIKAMNEAWEANQLPRYYAN